MSRGSFSRCTNVNAILLLCALLLGAGWLVLPRTGQLLSDDMSIRVVRYVAWAVNKPTDRIIELAVGREAKSDLSVHAAAVKLMNRAGITALGILVSLAACLLIILHRKKDGESSNGVLTLILLVANGTLIRLLLAYVCYGNYDMKTWELIADIAMSGGNVYAETARYQTSPLAFYLIGGLKYFQLHVAALPFHFVVRSFLTLIDLLTLICLGFIAKQEGTPVTNPALLFYFNPVSFLLTGYHGQIENVAVLSLVTGILCYYRLRARPLVAKWVLWAFATLALIVKHNILCQFLSCINASTPDRKKQALLILMSFTAFGISFLPFWNDGAQGIINNVVRYGSTPGIYGITSLINIPGLKYCFMIGALVFPLLLQGDDIIEDCMIGGLFLLVFITGIGIQYFVLPIAFAALRPSVGSLVYTIMTTLVLLGSPWILFTPGLSALHLNVVWFGATYWFVTAVFSPTVSLSGPPKINFRFRSPEEGSSRTGGGGNE